MVATKQHRFCVPPETLQNETNNFLSTTTNIGDFYNNANIFITGATGFVGKALLEKLLRTCQGIDTIYVLMRPKRAMAIQERLKELTENPVFNRIREKNPEAFDKIIAISGDVSLPELGLNNADKLLLLQKTNIVFHSAATVKFNEDLKNAVLLNTLGTKRVLELCHNMYNLKSFVHVSTAYSNSDKDVVDEYVYKPPIDPNALINCVEVLPKEALDILSKQLLGKHPNTYTFTKALAEHLVLESSSIIPAAVVRPSIITAAWKEPYPGWVDNVSGITGIFMECSRGTIKSIICNEHCKMDLVPVDIVVNSIITAAWHTAAYRSNVMRVYNCTSGNINPVTWKQFKQYTLKYSLEYPSKYVTWYPGFTYRTSRFMHFISASLFQVAPSILLDIFMICTRQKPIMYKISKKFFVALQAGSFFSTNQWDFKTATMNELRQAIKIAEDGEHYEVDMAPENGFDWDAYIKSFLLGVRQYVLKDDLTSLPGAKVKLNRLFWFQKVVHSLAILAVLRTISR